MTSLQDSPISHNHWSLSELKANLRVKHIDMATSVHPFLFFLFFFSTWIPTGSQCKSFQSCFTIEQEDFPLEKHSLLKVLVVLGTLTGCSQAGQDHTSRKVWLTWFPHWLSTQSALVNIAPQRSQGWAAGGRVQLIYGQAVQIRAFCPLMSTLLSAPARWVSEISECAL